MRQLTLTRFLPGVYNLPYTERLEVLNLGTLEARRLENELAFLFKTVFNMVDVISDKHFMDNVMGTQSHNFEINL